MRSQYSLVLFDVDSTLVSIEGIDRLAEGNAEVVELTSAAMNGEIPIEEVYARRLEIIRPDRAAIRRLADLYCETVLPDARDVVDAIRAGGADVHLVTAGIEQAILSLAGKLGLPAGNVHAVRLAFDPRGGYLDFDRGSPLTRAGGKEIVVLDLRARTKGKIAFVGDGVSDLETKEVVDLFIGFGGVAVRERVREAADVYVGDQRLSAILPFILEEES